MSGHRPWPPHTLEGRAARVLEQARNRLAEPDEQDEQAWVRRMKGAIAQVFFLGMSVGWDKRQASLEDEARSGPRRWAYGLTADEWLHLASEGTDSEVTPCCGQISNIRELLNMLATFQGSGSAGWRRSTGHQLLTALGPDGSGEHELNDGNFPLLARVVAGVRAERAAHEASLGRHPSTGLYAAPGATTPAPVENSIENDSD